MSGLFSTKYVKDLLTYSALVAGIIAASTTASFIFKVLLYGAVAYAFFWSLDRNVLLGYELAQEEEDKEDGV